MFNISAFIEDNFFLITSDNIDTITSRLYGFAIKDEKVFINTRTANSLESSGLGCYINVIVDDDAITIHQDFNGNYHLYVYEDGNYFAISNSLLFMACKIKDEHKLIFNESYSRYMFKIDMASALYRETIIERVFILPRNAILRIDKKSKTFTVLKKNKEKEVDIDSTEGIKLLDEWYDYYTSLFSSIANKGKIIVDLSGGFDSRASFVLFLHNKELLSKCKINTSTAKGHTLTEDFKIASAIAEKLGFQLNKDLKINYGLVSSREAMEMSFFTKLSAHSQMYFPRFRSLEYVFHVTGGGGESIREHIKMSPEQMISWVKGRRKSLLDADDEIEAIIGESLASLKKDISITDENNCLLRNFYREGRCRVHFGKACVEEFFRGHICIQPLLDKRLDILNPYIKNNKNRGLILTLILLRYAPELLEFEFDNGKKIDTANLELAKKINDSFPHKKSEVVKNNFTIVDETKILPIMNRDEFTPNELMFSLFLSSEIENNVIELYNHDAYDLALRERKDNIYFGDGLLCIELGVAIFKKICASSRSIFKERTMANTKSIIQRIISKFKR